MPTVPRTWLCTILLAVVTRNAAAQWDPTEILLPFQLNGPSRTNGTAIVYGNVGDKAAVTEPPAQQDKIAIIPDDPLAAIADDLPQPGQPEPDLLIEIGPESSAVRRPRFLGLVAVPSIFATPYYDWITRKDLAVVVFAGKLLVQDDNLWLDGLRQAGFRRVVIQWQGGNFHRNAGDTVVSEWSVPDEPAPLWRPSPPFLQLPSLFPRPDVSESDADLLIDLNQAEVSDWGLRVGNYPMVYPVSIRRPDTAISAGITDLPFLHRWLAAIPLPRRNLAIITLCDPVSSRDDLFALVRHLRSVGFARVVIQRPMGLWSVVVLDG